MNHDSVQNQRFDDPDAERSVGVLRAGLGCGPAKNPKQLVEAITEAQRHKIAVTINIPRVLIEYFKKEASKLGMTEAELMVRILETHKFANIPAQHLTLAIERKNGAV